MEIGSDSSSESKPEDVSDTISEFNSETVSDIIPELSHIKEITSLQDIIQIRDFVFSTAPWLIKPYMKKLHEENLSDIYKKLKEKTIGGWCGFNADLFAVLLYHYGIKTRGFNYGLQKSRFTHVVNIVEFDDVEYLMDPYFSSHYTDANGTILPFIVLLKLIAKRKFDEIKTVYSNIKKPIQCEDGSFKNMSPQELFLSVLKDWKINYNFDNIMNDIFCTPDPKTLMLIQI
jgi:hypothetical protein